MLVVCRTAPVQCAGPAPLKFFVKPSTLNVCAQKKEVAVLPSREDTDGLHQGPLESAFMLDRCAAVFSRYLAVPRLAPLPVVMWRHSMVQYGAVWCS